MPAQFEFRKNSNDDKKQKGLSLCISFNSCKLCYYVTGSLSLAQQALYFLYSVFFYTVSHNKEENNCPRHFNPTGSQLSGYRVIIDKNVETWRK